MKKKNVNFLFQFSSFRKKITLIKDQMKEEKDDFIFYATNKIVNKIFDKKLILRIMIDKILLSHFMHLTPYPTKLNDNDLKELKVSLNLKKGMYMFEGNHGNNIISTNFIVPDYKKSMIPFTTFIQKNKKIHTILSNIFYYEVYIGLNANRPSWPDKAIGIGFGKTIFNNSKMVGWDSESIGYHSDDGNIFYENKSIKHSKYGPGDTVGTGVILISPNVKKFFFTLNGKLIYMTEEKNIKNSICPQISFDYNYPIKINYGLKEFKFDYTELINSNFTVNFNCNFMDKLNYSNFTVKNLKTKLPNIVNIIFKSSNIESNITNLIDFNSNENIENLVNQNVALSNIQNLVNEYSPNNSVEDSYLHNEIPDSWEESINDES